MVEVQYAEHDAFVNQRNAERGFDIEPGPYQLEVLPARPTANLEWPRIGGGPARNPFAERNPDLVPKLGLDTDRDANAQLSGLRVEQHQRATIGTGNAHGDFEHPREQFVGVDGQVHRLDHFVECL